MRKLAMLGAAVALTVISVASPADAITRGGTLDGDAHPYVGLMIAKSADGGVLWRCSGTLVSPTVYVTAGHCTEARAARAEIWFESDVDAGIPGNGYPFGGTGVSVSGTTYVYDAYLPEAFYFADLGAVVLDEPYHLPVYATLPTAGYVESQLARGRKNATVTAVGYGLQAATQNPVKQAEKTQADRVRYQADLMVVDTKGVAGIGNLPGSFSMTLSGDAKHGGTCFGDSGGPSLHGDTLVAVTSFGLNGNCAGIGGVYRIDGDAQLAWINSLLAG